MRALISLALYIKNPPFICINSKIFKSLVKTLDFLKVLVYNRFIKQLQKAV